MFLFPSKGVKSNQILLEILYQSSEKRLICINEMQELLVTVTILNRWNLR
jgi:hypothetical protein